MQEEALCLTRIEATAPSIKSLSCLYDDDDGGRGQRRASILRLRQQPSPNCPSFRELLLERSTQTPVTAPCVVGRVHRLATVPARETMYLAAGLASCVAGLVSRKEQQQAAIACLSSTIHAVWPRKRARLSRRYGHWQSGGDCLHATLVAVPLAFTGSSSWQIWFDQDPIVLFWTVCRNTRGGVGSIVSTANLPRVGCGDMGKQTMAKWW